MNIKDKIPTPFDRLPEIDLYMDQLLSIVGEKESEDKKKELTRAMVNNYAKAGLMPRAVGKRYQKEHIVWLTLISQLKEVYSVNELHQLVEELEGHDARELYETYSEYLEKAIDTLEKLGDDPLLFAAFSYIYKLRSEELLKGKEDTLDK